MKPAVGLLLALGLTACGGWSDPVPVADLSLPAVRAVVETEPVNSKDDAADDPAIWVDPADPGRSLIVASQKQYGVLLYELSGKLLQSIPAGRINNVDLRQAFPLGSKTVAIVAGSNRSDQSLDLWALDPATRQLVDVADGALPLGLADPYGLCLYRSAGNGSVQVFVNDKDGRVQQWKLVARGNGKIGIDKLREFRLDSQPEGCVADDQNGLLYLGEEGRGVWRMAAEADGGEARALIDQTGAGGRLVADVEGMSLWLGSDGGGYLIVSSQGEHAYAVYERKAPNRYLGKFAIVDDAAAGIDGSQETDGLDVTSIALGGPYGRGLLVVQDGYNTLPTANQNFKLVPFARVIEALGLR
ncbi:MAG: phytase [Panacagrimonas sp.]